jgi:hypothetical protein
MNEVLVNRADRTEAPDLPDGWVIVNAPRPLMGLETWTGPFRHGIFYAAGPDPSTVTGFDREQAERRVASWRSDDAWPVVFTSNAEIEQRVLAKFAEYGYGSAGEAGITIAEQAYSMGLPWHEEEASA